MKQNLQKYQDAELLSFYQTTRQDDYLIELYKRYLPCVYGVALKYLRNIPEAQDIVMQIWEELFEKVQHHDITVFKNWLYICVRNRCLMELRKKSGHQFVELDEKFMEFCDDFHLYHKETPETNQALHDCLETLPEKQQQCVRYFYWEELSYKEIEQKSGFQQKQVKSFIQNGKRNLRLCLEQKGIKQHVKSE